jgi:pimeloyl-ACP methyl ester carboxylesterase
MWIEQLCTGPAAVVGQSLGGHTAFLLAARRPELVRAVVVAEATPEPDPNARGQVAAWLDAWPVPFSDLGAAAAHFGGGLRGTAWAEGLERRDDGLWPAFDRDVMLAALDELERRDQWQEWTRVSCPALVVRAARSGAPEISARMLETNRNARLVEMKDAGHDLHLDQPDGWRSALEAFFDQLG